MLCCVVEPSDGQPCNQREERERSVLKRVMLGYLENELDNEEKKAEKYNQ